MILLLYPSKQEARRILQRKCNSEWRKKHPEQMKKYIKKYRLNHPHNAKKEKRRIQQKKWIEEHPGYYREWRKNNPDKSKEITKRSYCKHKLSRLEHTVLWSQTPEGKASNAKKQAKRKRELGYEPLNDWFVGSEGHHININQVVYIPKELHKQYPHNHNKPESMEAINRIAMQYLFNYKK